MNKRKIKRCFNVLIILFFIIGIFYIISKAYSLYMLPQGKRISKNYAVTYINSKTDSIISTLVKENNYTTEDFFVKTVEDNKITSITVNSILVNELCNKISAQLSKDLNEMENKPVLLRLGSITGINILNNKGPAVKLHICNNGNTIVDYDTVFNSVGINQVNFQVYINVKAQVYTLLPLNRDNLTINRKIMLVNTVFSGDVPIAYLDSGNKNH